MMSQWRGAPVVRSSVGLIAALLFVLVVMAPGPFATASSAGSPQSWKAYFPTRAGIGRACTLTLPPESTSDATNTVTTTGTQVDTLVAIKSIHSGDVYTFRLKVVTHQTTSAPVVPAAMTSTSPPQTLRYTEILKYLVLKNGTVEAPLENQESVQSEFGVKGHLFYPSMSDIAKGKSTSGLLHFWFTSSTTSGVASIEAVTKGHAQSIRGSLMERVTGIFRAKITTPSETFRNVIGLRQTASRLRVLNAISPQIATALEEEMRDVVQSNTTTFWYAPSRGMVSRWNVSSDGTKTVSDTVCAPA